MPYLLTAALIVLSLFGAMLLFLEIGRRIGSRAQAKHKDAGGGVVGAVDGAVFGLMGLLIAFSFSGAATRFDYRRQLIVEEANAIGTAYLRLDLLPPAARAKLRQDFARYVDARLAVYKAPPNMEAVKPALELCAAIQLEIWNQAVAAAREVSGSQASMLLLPAMNAMIDITATRTFAAEIHPPPIILALLVLLALLCSLLAGHAMGGRETIHWLHMVGFAAIMSLTIYVIFDLEYPRRGLIRIDPADHVLADLREAFE